MKPKSVLDERWRKKREDSDLIDQDGFGLELVFPHQSLSIISLNALFMTIFSPVNTEFSPKAIGPYSQATKVGGMVFLSGQIPLVPDTMELVEGGIEQQSVQVFENIREVVKACGGSLEDIVLLTVYLTGLDNFGRFNTVMDRFFAPPYPARVTVGVSELPRASLVEVAAIMTLL